MKSRHSNQTTPILPSLAAALALCLCAVTVTGCDLTVTDTADASSVASVASSTGGLMEAASLFTERDLTQTADTSGARRLTVTDGQTLNVTEAGVYIISGKASDASIVVKADSDDKVQLVLDNVSLTNSDTPCIYCKKAKKVFVTLTGENTLSVTHPFAADVSSGIDGVIFSKTDLVCNGTGSLTVTSSANGIVCKDNFIVTGGTYSVTAASKSIDVNDSVRIADGTFHLTGGTDGIHAENNDDDTLGYIYIGGGRFTVEAGDDGIHAASLIQIDDGRLDITAGEGMEGTHIQINGGTLHIRAMDDGINAAHKSKSYTPTAEINGGDVTILMTGDGDGIDSNGNIVINGGDVTINSSHPFDYDGTARLGRGTVTVNGQQIRSIPPSYRP